MNLILPNDTLSPEFIELISKAEIRSEYPSLDRYFDQHNIPVSPSELSRLQSLLNDTIHHQVDYFCHLVYFIMERRNKWGDGGEEQVKASFCRNVLNIPHNTQITYMDVVSFNDLVQNARSHHGINKYSITKAEKRFDAFTFKIGSLSFQLHDCHEITKIMNFCGLPLILQGGHYGAEKEVILGTGKQDKTGEYDIIYLENEINRTPNTIVSMAAIIGDKQIYLRREAIETIFYQKWLPLLHIPYHDPKDIPMSHALSAGIKQLALNYSDIDSVEEAHKKKDTFIADILETIRYHELGHGIIQYHYFDKEIGAFCEATKMLGETIFTAVLETLAEIAPHYNGLKGPLAYLCDLAKSDPIRATRIFYTYLSDAWFYDTTDTHMFAYSDLICLIMIQSIQPDHSIDFNKLYAFIDPNNPKNLVDWFISCLSNHAHTLMPIFKSARYTYKKKSYTFDKLSGIIEKNIEENYPTIDYQSYNYYTAFWSELLEIYCHTSTNKADIDRIINTITVSIKKDVLNVLSPHDSAQSTIQSIIENDLLSKDIHRVPTQKGH